MADRPTSVYIIECAGYVKIGVARNPTARLRHISCGTPVKPVLLHTRTFEHQEIAFQVETRLHWIFRAHRANGEWFKVAPEVAWERLRSIAPLPKRRRTKSHTGDQRPTPEVFDELRAALNARPA